MVCPPTGPFDGVTVEAAYSDSNEQPHAYLNGQHSHPLGSGQTLGLDYGEGVTKRFGAWILYPTRGDAVWANADRHGFHEASAPDVRFRFYGTHDGGASGGTLIGDTGAFADVDGIGPIVVASTDKQTPYRGFYFEASHSDTAHGGESGNVLLAECSVYEISPQQRRRLATVEGVSVGQELPPEL